MTPPHDHAPMSLTTDSPHSVPVEHSDDDFDTLRQIKADPLLKTIPAVVVTASADPRDADYCGQSGADAHHVKLVGHPDHLQVPTALLDYRLVKVPKPTAQRHYINKLN